MIQARQGSKRYPNKILKARVGGKLLLQEIKERLKRCDIDDIIVALPTSDTKLMELCSNLNLGYFNLNSISENDVFGRFVATADFCELEDKDWILRICGDAPFIEPMFVNQCIYVTHDMAYSGKFGAVACLKYPFGQQVELFRVGTLRKIYKKIKNNKKFAYVREHIDPILKWKSVNTLFMNPLRLSIDTKADEEILNNFIK